MNEQQPRPDAAMLKEIFDGLLDEIANRVNRRVEDKTREMDKSLEGQYTRAIASADEAVRRAEICHAKCHREHAVFQETLTVLRGELAIAQGAMREEANAQVENVRAEARKGKRAIAEDLHVLNNAAGALLLASRRWFAHHRRAFTEAPASLDESQAVPEDPFGIGEILNQLRAAQERIAGELTPALPVNAKYEEQRARAERSFASTYGGKSTSRGPSAKTPKNVMDSVKTWMGTRDPLVVPDIGPLFGHPLRDTARAEQILNRPIPQAKPEATEATEAPASNNGNLVDALTAKEFANTLFPATNRAFFRSGSTMECGHHVSYYDTETAGCSACRDEEGTL